ncbi:MAG: OmpA family protein [Aquificae bacterium]|nr:OmpA family protein [Aquificota bacterium]
MKKTLLLGLAGSLFVAGCGTKVEDPCEDPNAALSKYLVEKCYGHYFEQIEKNKTDIAQLKSDVSTLKSDVEALKSDVESIKEELNALKITGKEQVRVYFDSGKFYLREDAKAALDELIEAVSDKDIKMVLVVGYASKPGTRGYNLELSMKRAQVVSAYLVRNGIPVEKIHQASYGEEIADLVGETYPEQRAVDVIVFY